MKRFKLLGGGHVGEDGEKYKKGAIVESPYDLATMFPNKFKRLASKGSDEEEEEDPEEDTTTDEGEDATEKFADAVKAGLKVRKVGKLYIVTDPDDTDAGQLDEGDLSSMAKVNAFIADYIVD